jgi:hypothetical protein
MRATLEKLDVLEWLECLGQRLSSRGITPSRPVPPAGVEIKFTGGDDDDALRNFAVFSPLDNLEFFKYSQIFRDIVSSF